MHRIVLLSRSEAALSAAGPVECWTLPPGSRQQLTPAPVLAGVQSRNGLDQRHEPSVPLRRPARRYGGIDIHA